MARIVRIVVGVLLVGATIFYLGGGWYFSDQLIADAFSTDVAAAEENSVVAAASDDSVTLEPGAGEDPELGRDGVFGLRWDAGYGRVGQIASRDGDTVTRPYEDRFGSSAPEAGTPVDVDPIAFPSDPQAAFGLDYETVDVPTPLGPMEAWQLDGEAGTWVVHVHGKGASRTEALRALGPLAAAGYPQLVISYRNDPGGPEDPSGYYRYGATEWEDLAGAVDLAVAEGADEVILYGYSTGAALALAYLERTPEAPVSGAVFDAPNIDFAATVDFNASRRELPVIGLPVPSSLAWTARTITSIRIGVDWGELDYVDRAGDVSIPVLVFHGTDDTTVPIETSRRFAAASNRVTLVEVDGAEHVQAWNHGPGPYEERMLDGIADMAGRDEG